MSFLGSWRSGLAINLALLTLINVVTPAASNAQFGGLKKRAIQIAFCGGGAVGGYKLGEKLAEIEAKKKQLEPAEAAKHRRAFQIGMAAALCGAGALVSGTIYDKLGERDRKAREKEMDTALAAAEPGVHSYVLPESGYKGEITTENVEVEGGRECKTMVDRLAGPDEPARARFCRKPPKGDYELDI